jgi:ubiquinone/menaquinone biosynthesis C-methylase UbiE
MSLSRHKQDWEDLAQLDPCWSILSNPAYRYGKWDLDAFFQTGAHEVEQLMSVCAEIGRPTGRRTALDFGCGVGRVTRALGAHFQSCYGLDISESMIARARELNPLLANATFVVNTEMHLKQFTDRYFDLIYTRLVLQHIPQRSTIKAYLGEFLRVLRPDGLLVFQLPSYLSPRGRLQRHRRMYAVLKAMGFSRAFLYRRLGLCPMRMNFIPEREVLAFLEANGGRVLRVEADTSAGLWSESRTYSVTRR